MTHFKNKLAFVWTTVPSGIIKDGGAPHLKVQIIVSPKLHTEQAKNSLLLNRLLNDWPAELKARNPVLSKFTVTFKNDENAAPDDVVTATRPIIIGHLVKKGIWPDVFQGAVIDEGTAEPLGRLPVDGNALSYNACEVERQVRGQRGLDMSAAAVRHALRNTRGSSPDVRARAVMSLAGSSFEKSEVLSQIAWAKPPSRDEWAQENLDTGKLSTAPPEINMDLARPEKDRENKLVQRNFYRVSNAPNERLRSDVLDRIEAISQAGGTDPDSGASDPAANDFLDLAMFHGRAKQLPRSESDILGSKATNSHCDFFQLLGMVRDYPNLARPLGLILEVRVPVSVITKNPDFLTGNRCRVWVTPHWKEDCEEDILTTSPSTWCDIDLDDPHFAASEVIIDPTKPDDPKPDDGHKDGYLHLHATDKNGNNIWQLTTVEIDGAAIKISNAAENTGAAISPSFITDSHGNLMQLTLSAIKLLTQSATGELSDLNDKTIFELATCKEEGGLRAWLERLVRDGRYRQKKKCDLEITGPPNELGNGHAANNGVASSSEHATANDIPNSVQFTVELKCYEGIHEKYFEWIMLMEGADSSSFEETNPTPSMRSVGLSLIRRDAGVDMGETAERQKAFLDSANGANAEPGEPRLAAADLIAGYVPEIHAPIIKKNNREEKWLSTTERLEKYRVFGDKWFPGEGTVSLGLVEADDAAPAEQQTGNPEVQGAASPALFVYTNDSLACTAPRESQELPEPESTAVPPPKCDEVVELRSKPGSLPLVRYSDATASDFEYRVRCRYIDIAGNTRPLKEEENNAVTLPTHVRREEPVDPPRPLTKGRLNLKARPGAGLKQLVVRQFEDNCGCPQVDPCDVRCFVPPKATADMVLRYGLGFKRELKRKGGLSSIRLTEYAEIPKEKCLVSPDDAGRDIETPAYFPPRGRRPKEGFYYLPDPMSKGVTIAVHTFYSIAHGIDPIYVTIPFYSSRCRWPNAQVVWLKLCHLPAGEVKPKVQTRGRTFEIFLPLGWTGRVDVSSVPADDRRSDDQGPSAAAIARHFAAWEDYGVTRTSDEQFARILIDFAGKEASFKVESFVNAIDAFAKNFKGQLPWRFRRLRDEIHSIDDIKEANARWQSYADNSMASVAASIASGKNPVISPTDRIELVCAVQKPLFAPTLSVNGPKRDSRFKVDHEREVDSTEVELSFESKLDKKSTSQVEIAASWRKLQDDPNLGDPKCVWDSFRFPAQDLNEPAEYNPVLWNWDSTLDLGTANYRKVRYRISGKTRFASHYKTADIGDLSLEGESDIVIHPNVTRPKKISVEFLVPTITWTSSVEPLINKPKWKFTSQAKWGIRVYCGRGWDLEELLGVITYPSIGGFSRDSLRNEFDFETARKTNIPEALKDAVTQWGADPTVVSELPPGVPTASDFVGFRHVDSNLRLPGIAAQSNVDDLLDVTAVGYRRCWDKRRKLWYFDIGISSVPSYGRFIRLALSRFQPHSKSGYELSEPILADFIQVRPDRVVNILRDPHNLKGKTIRVVVAEPLEQATTPLLKDVDKRGVRNRFCVHVEQPCITQKGTEPGWIKDEHIILDTDATCPSHVLWSGAFTWPDDSTGRRRLVLREFERFPHPNNKDGEECLSDTARYEREIFSNVIEV